MESEAIVKKIITNIGDDINREALRKTPQRAAKAWGELFKGYDVAQRPTVTAFQNPHCGTGTQQTITDQGVFYSHCEHHLLPFFGAYTLSYIPDRTIVGLSKIQRLVSYHASRLQTQENLTKVILDDFETLLQPHGLSLTLTGRHMCREMRGVCVPEQTMVTTERRGVLSE